MSDFSPRQILERTFHYWWLVAACTLLGGIGAWIFSLFHPPIYAATAAYSVSLDQQTIAAEYHLAPDQLPLDFTHQNEYLSPAADVFFGVDVRSRVVSDAAAHSIEMKSSDFDTVNFSLDRRSGDRWLLTVQNTDPSDAAQLTNLWAAAADSVLRAAQAHSAKAMVLQEQHNTILKCFSGASLSSANGCAGTAFASSSEEVAFLNDLEEQIIAEQAAGRNIDPALQFSFVRPADPPSVPVLYDKSLVLLAGLLIGLFGGSVVMQFLPAVRK